MYAIQHRCILDEIDLCYFRIVLLRITIIYLTKHRCIHVRNFVRKKPPQTTSRDLQNITNIEMNFNLPHQGYLANLFSAAE